MFYKPSIQKNLQLHSEPYLPDALAQMAKHRQMWTNCCNFSLLNSERICRGMWIYKTATSPQICCRTTLHSPRLPSHLVLGGPVIMVHPADTDMTAQPLWHIVTVINKPHKYNFCRFQHFQPNNSIIYPVYYDKVP